MATHRKGYQLQADGEEDVALSGSVDRLLAQEALDDEEQELLIKGLESIHYQQKSRNASVLATMTVISALGFTVAAFHECLRKDASLRGLLAPLSSLVGHLPFLAHQLKLNANAEHRFRNAQKSLDRLRVDMRYMILWHAVPLVAGFLQRDPWQSLLLWFIPPALAACTLLAESDAQDLDFTLATLKGQTYGLKGA